MWTSLHFPQQLFAEEIAAALRLVNSGGYITQELDHYPPEGLPPGTPVERIELILEDILSVHHRQGDSDEYLSIPDLTLVVYTPKGTIRLREVTEVAVRNGVVTFGSTHNFRIYRAGHMPLAATPKYLVTLKPQNVSDPQRQEARAAAQRDLWAAQRRRDSRHSPS